MFFAFKVDDGDPPFPRPAGYWWFGCETSSQQLRQNDTRTVVNIQSDQRSDVPLRDNDNFDVSSEILDAGMGRICSNEINIKLFLITKLCM